MSTITIISTPTYRSLIKKSKSDLVHRLLHQFEALWRPIETAPRDGTLILLLVNYDGDDCGRHPLENDLIARTVGFNNRDHDGEDRWHFAGWCWEHDHFVEGRGTPVSWMPFAAPPAPEAAK